MRFIVSGPTQPTDDAFRSQLCDAFSAALTRRHVRPSTVSSSSSSSSISLQSVRCAAADDAAALLRASSDMRLVCITSGA